MEEQGRLTIWVVSRRVNFRWPSFCFVLGLRRVMQAPHWQVVGANLTCTFFRQWNPLPPPQRATRVGFDGDRSPNVRVRREPTSRILFELRTKAMSPFMRPPPDIVRCLHGRISSQPSMYALLVAVVVNFLTLVCSSAWVIGSLKSPRYSARRGDVYN